MSQSPEEQAKTAERRARVIELRRRRLTFADIGTDLGVTTQRAHQIYEAALKDLPDPGAELHRAEEILLIDEAIKRLMVIAEDPEQAVAAWNSIRGWAERKARLLGLDAPVKADVGGKLSYEIIGIDPEQL